MEITNITKKRIHEYLEEGKRFDGRKLLEYRKIEIETGVSNNAEGSAKVKIGDTEVIAGVKIDAVEPYTDHKDEGTLITTVELLPLSSPDFEYGPPRIEAIEMARIIDRGVRESKFIDFKGLCIKEGEKVHSVLLDIFSLNNDGNLLDAMAIAAVIALKTAKMPKYDEKEGKVKYGEWTNKPVPLNDKLPINMTFHKIDGNILLDPTSEEEEASEARLSLCLTKKGKEIFINAMQKGGEKPFKAEEIEKIMETAVEKYKELEAELEKKIEKAKKN